MSKDESSVLNKSHFLKKVSNKKLFIGRPTQRLRIIYSLYQGEVEILEILTHDRANLFLSKYYTGGKSWRLLSNLILILLNAKLNSKNSKTY